MIKLVRNKRVFFEPQTHTYLLDGEEVLLGVTELMKLHDLGADYKGISDETLKKAAAEGTALHNEIESYESGEAILISPFLQQYQKLGLRCIATEYLVSDNQTVASKIDGVYEGEKGVILVDYKFTQKYHRAALEAQLSIYKVLFERQNPGVPVEGLYCLWGDKKSLKIKGLIPVNDIGAEWVDELIACEREGRVFIDTREAPEAALVLSDEEVADVLAKAIEVEKLKKTTEALEEVLKGYYGKVRDYMLQHNLTEMAAPGGKFTLKAAYTRTSIDSAKLKKVAPELATQCAKTTTVAASVSFKPDDKGQ